MSRVLIGAFGDAGHAFPAIGLARALAAAGHEVCVETWERWREDVVSVGASFEPAQQYVVFPTQSDAGSASAAEAARALLPLFDDFEPDLVVSDILTLATSLAAEVRGIPGATLVPHLWPVSGPGLPFFGFGSPPPRSGAGRALWRGLAPVLNTGLRRGLRELNEQRRALGLPETGRLHGGISERLALVATLPQLEYPRRWPGHVHVIGPLFYERPFPDVQLPDGDEPLVLVAPSTAKDPEGALIRRTFEALADEPVRVIATTNGHLGSGPIDVPPNASLVEWLSYSQVMPLADLVICHGGHGTVCRALGHGTPVLCAPIAGDMLETAARVQWAGLGRSIPWRVASPRAIRWVTEAMLADGGYRNRAAEIEGSAASADVDAAANSAVADFLP